MNIYTHLQFTVILAFLMQKICFSKSYSIDEMCKSMLPEDYKVYEIPEKNVPVKIYNRFTIIDIGEIDEKKMDYLLHAFVINIWSDPRIKMENPPENPSEPTFVTNRCLEHFWTPKIFFQTAKVVDNFKSSAPAIYLKMYSDGKISLSQRYLMRSSCNMRFHDYPFDTQRCEFVMSVASPNSQTHLHWIEEDDSVLSDFHNILILRNIEPLQYALGETTTYEITDQFPDANYTNLVIEFVFRRRLVGSVVNTYIPSTLIVTMSWIGFWLGVEAVPARVALSITSLLTLCTQAQQYQSHLPPVNYIKAMDIWLFVCIFLVFSTLLEFAVAYNFRKQKEKVQVIWKNPSTERTQDKHSRTSRTFHSNNQKDKIVRGSRVDSSESNGDTEDSLSSMKNKLLEAFQQQRRKLQDQSVDKISQKLFPGFFIIFALFYWTYYLTIYY